MKAIEINEKIESARKESLGICLRFRDYCTLNIMSRTFRLFHKYPHKRYEILKVIIPIINRNVLNINERKELKMVIDELHVGLNIPCSD